MPEFFARQNIIAQWNQRAIEAATPLVIGAGALGNEVVKNLVQLGVKDITVVDFDAVEEANLNRCCFFSKDDVGKSKVLTLARKASAMLSSRIHPIEGRVEELKDEQYSQFSHVLLCLDNLGARLHANARAYAAGVWVIDGGTTGFFGKLQVARAPGACVECSLGSKDYQDMWRKYSCKGEVLDMLDPKMPALSTTTSIVAAMQVAEFAKTAQGLPNLEGKYVFYNGLSGEFRTLELSKRASCPVHA